MRQLSLMTFLTMWQTLRRWHFWPLIALLVLCAGWMQRQPWPADEPRFVLVAQQMVESGDYLLPHRGIELYPDKPPVFMWMLAASYKLTGNWQAAFLLPSFLAGLLVLWLVHRQARSWFGVRAANLSVFALLFSVQFTYQFKRAQIDPVLVALVTAGVYQLLRYYTLDRKPWRLCAAMALAGIGVVTKGVGIIVVLMLPVAWFASYRAAGHLVPAASHERWWLRGIVAFVCLLVPIVLWLTPLWLAVKSSQNPEYSAYLQNILFKQTATRYTNAWHHHQPAWYFLEVMLTTWIPISIAALFLWRGWWRRISAKGLAKRPDARYLLSAGFVLLVVLFFSISPGKRDMYILPALPIAALMCGPGLILLGRNRIWQHLLTGVALCLSIGLLLLGLIVIMQEPSFATKLAARHQFVGNGMWWSFAAAGLLSLVAVLFWQFKSRSQRGFYGFVSVLASLWILPLGFIGLRELDAASSGRLITERARSVAGDDATIGFVDWKEQHYLQMRGTKTEFGFSKPLREQRLAALNWIYQNPVRHFVIVQDRAMDAEDYDDKCFLREKSVNLGVSNRRRWYLVNFESIPLSCAVKRPQ
jgi:4-amino-4-deoxy-L-arabinose transferase-like glycosyltransferase